MYQDFHFNIFKQPFEIKMEYFSKANQKTLFSCYKRSLERCEYMLELLCTLCYTHNKNNHLLDKLMHLVAMAGANTSVG